MLKRIFFQIVFLLFLSSMFIAIAVQAQDGASTGDFGWEVSNREIWQSPDGSLLINFYPQQQVKIVPLGLPSLPSLWQPLTAAYTIQTADYIKEIKLKGEATNYSGTAVLVKVSDNEWVELKTKLNKDGWRVVEQAGSATIVLAQRADRLQGIASWYRYKNCLCAASRHYPKGTQLEVSRADNPDKKIIVKVNDYGPEAWTGRVLDLDVVAFKKLAVKTAGLMTVVVKPR